ncbi:uncharacterized protein LOC103313818 isoform X1 [Tribolium castaneum]|uniref:Uncharacterized protein n=1 Tax=Tribolium castaneum TaxID=7070 RepID=A0A139WFG1_TRICA|nr:PREDICTED: uncharacterized protein LOC103313818 isoform X2 [Tribolium castaneum]KYB26575.1 hypothetical protein TcasGA2_TC033874 [Tribolium castaneum]|eukprot:XP_015837471.1 PREDICTED: uncharacterized protein LOC103313818 isoform X2 [Tribolium castaneum]
MFPDATEMYSKWDIFYEKLLNCENVNKLDDIVLTQLKNETLSEDGSLRYKSPPCPFCFHRKEDLVKNVHWKPSIVECEESIINHVKICGEIENFIIQRRPVISELTQSYLIIDAFIYKDQVVPHCHT